MKHVTEVLIAMGVIVSAAGAAFVIGSYMDSIPDVHFSNSSGLCVRVVSLARMSTHVAISLRNSTLSG
jgi:hypothetical protein